MIILQEIKILLEQSSVSNLLKETSKELASDNYLESRSIYKDEKLSEQYSSKFEKLSIQIYIVKHNSINAFTIPGVSDYAEFLKNPNYHSFNGLVNLYNNPISAELKNNKIVFNRKINIVCFLHSALIERMKPAHIDAIILHEIGHWVYTDKGFFQQAILRINKIFLSKPFEQIDIPNLFINNDADNLVFPIVRTFAILSIIMNNFFSRNSEYLADKFAKDMGYGKELYDALSLMEFNKILKEKDLNNFSLKFKIYFKYIGELISSYFTSHTASHPTTISRLSNLIKESLVEDIGTKIFETLLIPIDAFLSGIILKVCPWVRL